VLRQASTPLRGCFPSREGKQPRGGVCSRPNLATTVVAREGSSRARVLSPRPAPPMRACSFSLSPSLSLTPVRAPALSHSRSAHRLCLNLFYAIETVSSGPASTPTIPSDLLRLRAVAHSIHLVHCCCWNCCSPPPSRARSHLSELALASLTQN
jgi:hypothetical protein